MQQPLRDLYDDIEPALRLFRFAREIQSRLLANHADQVEPIRIELHRELRDALEKEIASEGYDLCAFIEACVEEHPDIFA